PTHRYALMIDAGSTGSRIHVYRFSFCDSHLPTSQKSKAIDNLPTLDHELFFKTQPGLSSYAGRPKEAAESLRPLLRAAIDGVPPQERACTPISVKATAGLRLLGDRESDEILKEVEGWLRDRWPFRLPDKSPVAIMDGADEGVYAWVTVNYLLKQIGSTPSKGNHPVTAAVMDLGGASTQIVFEPTGVRLEPGSDNYQLSFGNRTHTLYQHSHLGYGLMEARKAVHQLVSYSDLWRRKTVWSSISDQSPIGNPCLQRQISKNVTISTDGSGGELRTVEFLGDGSSFEDCSRLVEVMISKQTICKIKPCAFAGVYQPRLSEAFPSGPIYALSYFYDRLNPLGLRSRFTLKQLARLAERVCKGPKSDGKWELSDRKSFLEDFRGDESNGDGDRGLIDLDVLDDELNGRPEACLDLSFIYGLLRFGYEIDENREIIVSKKINGVELGWTLGATIDLLEKNKVENC
ncbi:guanosine-diphosphatase, partial [Phakopsora pachyrhizi]